MMLCDNCISYYTSDSVDDGHSSDDDVVIMLIYGESYVLFTNFSSVTRKWMLDPDGE